jgi:hypothetical protein
MPMRQRPRFHFDKAQPGHPVELSCHFLCLGTAATPLFRPGWFGALELIASACASIDNTVALPIRSQRS